MALGPLILDVDGTRLDDVERELLLSPAVGGVILFGRNVVDYNQVADLLAEIRELRPELLLCVDQEGGRVQRCRQGFTRFPPMQVFDAEFTKDPARAISQAEQCGWLLAAEVLSVGFDLSFTPVLDVDDNFSSVIGDRAFSSDPQRVTELAGAFIKGAHRAGMAVTGKHFPGHGSVREDSHLDLPIDTRPMAAIESHDLLPFKALLGQLEAVMPAHIVFDALDSSHTVGFSKPWLNDVLRKDLGFAGVIVSDDLTMEGAARYGDFVQRAELALNAGCDLILVCNHREGALKVVDALEINPRDASASIEMLRARQHYSKKELIACAEYTKARETVAALLDADHGK